jgi:excisionase family DNA binding protein
MRGEKEMLRPADLARPLGVGRRRVYQLISAGVIPAVRVGGAIRVPKIAWEEWLRGRSAEALSSLEDATTTATAVR